MVGQTNSHKDIFRDMPHVTLLFIFSNRTPNGFSFYTNFYKNSSTPHLFSIINKQLLPSSLMNSKHYP